ncbi:unnamed protein product [Acanthosepion pharaonis]|uniref:Uncharacterized protein n=1 Tax=Acanthosepion pharaonis TaxID=158019 RepID=A0A812DL87_ACAPH|nr:unnamed protein product [Sepia pharaonis]
MSRGRSDRRYACWVALLRYGRAPFPPPCRGSGHAFRSPVSERRPKSMNRFHLTSGAKHLRQGHRAAEPQSLHRSALPCGEGRFSSGQLDGSIPSVNMVLYLADRTSTSGGREHGKEQRKATRRIFLLQLDRDDGGNVSERHRREISALGRLAEAITQFLSIWRWLRSPPPLPSRAMGPASPEPAASAQAQAFRSTGDSAAITSGGRNVVDSFRAQLGHDVHV